MSEKGQAKPTEAPAGSVGIEARPRKRRRAGGGRRSLPRVRGFASLL